MPVVRITVVATREEFSRWLSRRLFEKFGLNPSRRQLATQAGMSPGTFSSLLQARRWPTEESVRRLARLLDMDVGELRKRVGIDPLFEFETEAENVLSANEEERTATIKAISSAIRTAL